MGKVKIKRIYEPFSPGDGYRIQETGDLTPPIQWLPVTATPTFIGGWYFVRLPEPGATRFYRLKPVKPDDLLTSAAYRLWQTSERLPRAQTLGP